MKYLKNLKSSLLRLCLSKFTVMIERFLLFSISHSVNRSINSAITKQTERKNFVFFFSSFLSIELINSSSFLFYNFEVSQLKFLSNFLFIFFFVLKDWNSFFHPLIFVSILPPKKFPLPVLFLHEIRHFVSFKFNNFKINI